MAAVILPVLHRVQWASQLLFVCLHSLHDRVVKKGVSFLRGNVSIITSSDLSDMHVISMNVILYYRLDEGRVNPTRVYLVLSCLILCVDSFVLVVNML